MTVKKVSKPVATTAAESQQPEASPSDGNIGVATVAPTNSSTNPSGSPSATDPQPTDAGVASQKPSVGPTKVPAAEEPSTTVPTATPKVTVAPTATAGQTNPPATGVPTAVPSTTVPTDAPSTTPNSSQEPTAMPSKVSLDLTSGTYINSEAYTKQWAGNTYNIGALIAAQGYQIKDVTKATVVIELLDENKKVIENEGYGALKLSTKNSDWDGFTDVNGVQSGKEFGLELETYSSDATDLYIVVQNSTATVKYIQITSIIMENNGKKDVTEVITNYEPLAALTENAGFRFGTNISSTSINKTELTKLIQYHFNSTTFSNEMKAYSLLKQAKSQENYENENSPACIDFTTADKMVEYARDNGLSIRGHVLVWDADMCDWFFREGYTTDGAYVSADVMKKRMQMYIEEVMTHFETKYPGVIYCWDVVNEAVADNTGDFESSDARHVRQVRDENTNLFYDHIGPDYVELAFKYAYETRKTLQAANSKTDIKLFYNDYNTFMTYGANKRDAIIELVKSINSYASDGNGGYLKLCDGIGMQSYIGGYGQQSGCMNESDITAIKTAIEKFANLGVEVHVTELAVRNYEDTAAREKEHAAFYKKLMQTYVDINKTAQENGKTGPLTSVSIWGLFDNPNLAVTDYSYKMNGPYCGLFTELYTPKEAFKEVYKVLADE